MKRACLIILSAIIIVLSACSPKIQDNSINNEKANTEIDREKQVISLSNQENGDESLKELLKEAETQINNDDYIKARATLIAVILCYPKTKYAEQAIDMLDKLSESKIQVHAVYSDKPDSAGGVDAHVIWTNTSNKSIKYIYFTLIPYNAVNDIVECEVRGTSEFIGRVTGPMPGTKYGENNEWKCAWYNNTIKKLVLTNIRIEYMDGMQIMLEDLQPYGIDKSQIDFVME